MSDHQDRELHAQIVEVVIAAIRTIKDAAELPPKITGRTRLYPHTDDELGTLELDSLDALDLITELERVFETDVYEDIDVSRIHTVDDVADFILEVMHELGARSERAGIPGPGRPW